MTGYYGEYKSEDIVDLCMAWLPVYSNGYGVIEGHLKSVGDIVSFHIMRERLFDLIESERQKVCN